MSSVGGGGGAERGRRIEGHSQYRDEEKSKKEPAGTTRQVHRAAGRALNRGERKAPPRPIRRASKTEGRTWRPTGDPGNLPRKRPGFRRAAEEVRTPERTSSERETIIAQARDQETYINERRPEGVSNTNLLNRYPNKYTARPYKDNAVQYLVKNSDRGVTFHTIRPTSRGTFEYLKTNQGDLVGGEYPSLKGALNSIPGFRGKTQVTKRDIDNLVSENRRPTRTYARAHPTERIVEAVRRRPIFSTGNHLERHPRRTGGPVGASRAQTPTARGPDLIAMGKSTNMAMINHNTSPMDILKQEKGRCWIVTLQNQEAHLYAGIKPENHDITFHTSEGKRIRMHPSKMRNLNNAQWTQMDLGGRSRIGEVTFANLNDFLTRHPDLKDHKPVSSKAILDARRGTEPAVETARARPETPPEGKTNYVSFLDDDELAEWNATHPGSATTSTPELTLEEKVQTSSDAYVKLKNEWGRRHHTTSFSRRDLLKEKPESMLMYKIPMPRFRRHIAAQKYEVVNSNLDKFELQQNLVNNHISAEWRGTSYLFDSMNDAMKRHPCMKDRRLLSAEEIEAYGQDAR